ncbi:MAG TPA: sodium:proton antiporter [Rhodothermales bacterium]|nr:sodium:proton antiporter [Rhodothermales bacterium]
MILHPARRTTAPIRPSRIALFALILLAGSMGSTVAAQDVPASDSVTAIQQDDPAAEGHASAEQVQAVEHHESPPFYLTIPFVVLLLMIATGPLFYQQHWHHHYPKWAVGLGLVTAAYYYFALQNVYPIMHAMTEYLSFIALLAALFIASGGIVIRVNSRGTPLANSTLLFVGAVISNVIGTTGASMLLIQPFMRLNQGRIKAYHIIFFIFIVSNVGGALTPIGDPPLFLGFLRGVPFFWTLAHVWYAWLPTLLVLIAIFYVFDMRNREESTTELREGVSTVRVSGVKNFFWLAAVVVAVFIDPNVFGWVPALHVGETHLPFGIREIIMFSICFLAYRFASHEALAANDFNFGPIKEVAWLFVGIFLTMQPALELIRDFANTNAETLTVSMFYWGTGGLSGVLDNAPTYVSFLSAAMGKFGMDVNVVADVANFSVPGVGAPEFLQAISIAAVFFGAMTYIGNGPNFMVKAIAEASGVDCPSFAGYVVRYSLPILLPVYFVVWVVMYSGWIL